MFTPNAEIMKTLATLNATYRFVHRGPTYKPSSHPGAPPEMISQGECRCEIFDLTVKGDPYCYATGETEREALTNAVEVAKTAAKPMTPAQRATVALSQSNDRTKQLEREIAELKAQLNREAADKQPGESGEQADVPPSPRRGRPRKIPSTPTPVEADA